MPSKKTPDTVASPGTLPFGAGAIDTPAPSPATDPRPPRREREPARDGAPSRSAAPERERQPAAERDAAREREPRERERDPARERELDREPARERQREPAGERGASDRSQERPVHPGHPGQGSGGERPEGEGGSRSRRRRWQERRRRRRRSRGGEGGPDGQPRDDDRPAGEPRSGDERNDHPERGERGERPERSDRPERFERPERSDRGEPRERFHDRAAVHGGRPQPAARPAPELGEGLLLVEHANHGHLRSARNGWLASRDDPHVPPRLVQRYALREGSILTGPVRRGQGRHKWELVDVTKVDGRDPQQARSLPAFKSLTSIDPDFHYAVGDESGEVSLKVLDIICPVGRGSRGLIVAPPRSGKTILLQQFARAIEAIYPEVHLIVLLIDERPEEATQWRRTIQRGEVFVSTNDELHKRHVDLAEAVWKRCRRLVELGQDVILLLDSITRLGRAYNNVHGTSGKTMSGGIDTRALERPKQFFGSARNTETAGSLTILGTTLVETGSRMDQVIFEEFKGTGNMELVLARRLADRRIFPAIDIERSGTRKEEKLLSTRRLHLINTLRRVLSRMHWAEAMELLISKLDDVAKTDDFLQRFEVDPEA